MWSGDKWEPGWGESYIQILGCSKVPLLHTNSACMSSLALSLCISMFPFLKLGWWNKAVPEPFSEAVQSHTSPKTRWKRDFKVDFVLLSLVTWGYWAIRSIYCSSQLSVNWNDCFNSWESVGHELWLYSFSPSHILCSSLDSVESSANSMLIGSNFERTRNLSLENIKEI